MLNDLMPHQKLAALAMSAEDTFWLCDKPGLGKTFTTVAAMQLNGCRGFIWITKGIALRATLDEIELRAPLHWRMEIVSANRPISPSTDAIVIPWSLLQTKKQLRHIREFAARRNVSHLILDEAHAAKSPDALRTKQVFGFICNRKGGLSEYMKRIYYLSGTPIKAHAGDLFPSLKSMRASYISDTPDWDSYTSRYCIEGKTKGPKKVFVGTRNSNFSDLAARMQPCVLYRHPEHVLSTMPPIIWNPVPLTDYWRTEITQDEEEYWSTARKDVGLIKAQRAARYAASLVDSGVERLLIFAHHREVIENIHEELATHSEKEPIHSRFIHGGISKTQAYEIVHAWQFNPDTELDVLVLQMDMAGEALTLHAHGACHHAIFAELPSAPATVYQCAKRLHRIGQPNSVVAHLVSLPGTLDDRLCRLMLSRLATDFTFEVNAGGSVNLEGVSLREALRSKQQRQNERMQPMDATRAFGAY